MSYSRSIQPLQRLLSYSESQRPRAVRYSFRTVRCLHSRSLWHRQRQHVRPKAQLRWESNITAAAASTSATRKPTGRDSLPTDAHSLLTRLKNLLLGTTIGLSVTLGYYYATDTRAGIHEWLVIPCLRYFYPDAEDAHEFGNKALKALYSFGIHPRERGNSDAKGDLAVEIFGHLLQNPIGTSAGIDKHCEIPDALLAAGPAVVEIGGVTPLPQEGNPKPRVWRLPSQKALINRYGLNSEGADHVAMRLRQRVREFAYHMGWGIDEEAEQRVLDGDAGVPPGSLQEGKLVAVQVAKNKWTKDGDIEAVKRDYVYCVDALARYADIVVVNVSSPNTPGLRGLQKVEPLTDILTAVVGAARKVKRKIPVRVMVKVSPDEDDEESVRGICDAVWDSGVDGVIVGNTTKKRPDPIPDGYLPSHELRLLLEQGGYSGPQTFTRTVALTRGYRKMLDEDFYPRKDNDPAPPSPLASSPNAKPKFEKQDIGSESDPRATNVNSSQNPPPPGAVVSFPLSTQEATHPPTTDQEISDSVARDREHLKTDATAADAESKSQPIIRIPERNNPFSSSSSSSSSAAVESPPPASSSSSTERENLAASTSTDTLPSLSSSSTSPPLSSRSSSSSSSSSSSPSSLPDRPRKVIFATGGITNGAHALEVLAAGADVAQVYTALVYGGIGTVSKIKEEMRGELRRRQ